MKSRTFVIALFAFLLINMTTVPVGPGEYVGHWRGLADGQVAFTLDIDIDDDELVATLNATDQGMVNIVSSDSEFGGDHEVAFDFDLPNGILLMLEGELNDDGKFIGTYDMGEQAGTFTATKIETDE